MEIILMLAMLATGGSGSNQSIESYCKASHKKL